MKKIGAALLWVLLGGLSGQLLAQESPPLFNIVHLKSGDVLAGQIINSTDSILDLEEWHLGFVRIQQKNIENIESVQRNSKAILTLGANTSYTGELLRLEDGMFVLKTALVEELTIPISQVKDIELLTVFKEVAYNPNATRYFFAPSAIPLKKGRGYYQNAYLLSNSVNFGISDNFTLGGGIVIPILFYITAKLSYEIKKNLYLGAGLIAASTFIPEANLTGGIPFGLVTYGSSESNVTLGIGYGMLWDDEGKFQQTHYPISTVNGMFRLSNRLQLVSENWIIPARVERDRLVGGPYYYDVFLQVPVDPSDYEDSNGDMLFNAKGEYVKPDIESRNEEEFYMAVSVGIRILIAERNTVDFTPVYLIGAENAPVIPYLDFVYKF